jgi:5-methylcytosine-specific restriction endonuclease McrA
MMLEKLTKPVLVLNKSWVAIGTSPVYKALGLLFSVDSNSRNKAVVIDEFCTPFTWEEWSQLKPEHEDDAIRTVNTSFRIPQIIRLVKYDKFPRQVVIFSRANIFKRDSYTCQYCQQKPGSEELTIDHIIPKSKGGLTTWENCVLSCVACNSLKGDRLPHEIKSTKYPQGMILLKKPIRPKFKDLFTNVYYESWKQWLDVSYWNVELENQNHGNKNLR